MNFRLRLDIHWSSVRSSSRPPGELPGAGDQDVDRGRSGPGWRPRSARRPRSRSCRRPAARPSAGLGGDLLGGCRQRLRGAGGDGDVGALAASCSATARPMPLLAPVTKATFPASCRSTATPSAGHRMGRHCPRIRRRRWRWPPPGLAGWYTKYHHSGSHQAARPHGPLMSRISVMIMSISSRFWRRKSVICRRRSSPGRRDRLGPGRPVRLPFRMQPVEQAARRHHALDLRRYLRALRGQLRGKAAAASPGSSSTRLTRPMASASPPLPSARSGPAPSPSPGRPGRSAPTPRRPGRGRPARSSAASPPGPRSAGPPPPRAAPRRRPPGRPPRRSPAPAW